MKKKINKLFKYRKLPYLLSFFKKKKADKLHNQLVDLQVAIYKLDNYLESNWDLNQKSLDKYWKKIYKALKVIGFSKKQSFVMTNHIRKYQKHEEQLRDGKMPTILNKEFYYYYKSCDVRLMRDIIYKLNPSIENHVKFEDWRYFDLLTEINDDVEDVFEDQMTINGNMFLIQILEQGTASVAIDFTGFIERTLAKENNRFSLNSSEASRVINQATFEEAISTQKLLDQNIEVLSKLKFSKGIPILKHGALKNTLKEIN